MITFILLSVLGYDSYTIGVLLKILSHSIMITVLYTSVLYASVHFFYKKLQLKEVK